MRDAERRPWVARQNIYYVRPAAAAICRVGVYSAMSGTRRALSG